MWFDSWSQVLRVVIVGSAAYVYLVLLLRISGKRTLAKLNAFDFVVTVALGSTLATVLLSQSVSWSEGATALGLLVVLQFVAAGVSAWVPGGHQVVTARPRMLLQDGRLDDDALTRCRVAPAEVFQAVRGSGHGDLSAIAAVVLEPDGSMSVIARASAGDGSALRGIRGPGAPA